MRLPLHVSVHIYDHLHGAREQYFMLIQLSNCTKYYLRAPWKWS